MVQYCLKQLNDLHTNPVQVLTRLEGIARYLQGEYDTERYKTSIYPAKRKTVK